MLKFMHEENNGKMKIEAWNVVVHCIFLCYNYLKITIMRSGG